MISVSFFTPIRWGVLSGEGRKPLYSATSCHRFFTGRRAGFSSHTLHAQVTEISIYFCYLLQFTKIHFLRRIFFIPAFLSPFKICLPWLKHLWLHPYSRPYGFGFSYQTPSAKTAFFYSSSRPPLAMIPAHRLRAQGQCANDRRQG